MEQTDLLAVNKTVGEIAELVGGEAAGDPSFQIASAAGLSEAGPQDISFLGNPKYLQEAAASQAGCLLLPASNPQLACAAKNRIFVEDPQYAFSQILSLIESRRPRLPAMISPKAELHYQARLGQGVAVGPFTIIERGAVVGEETRIAAQCYIGENTRIGRSCRIYPQVVIRENCVIGDRVILHSGTVVGADGFGFSTDRKSGRHRKIPQLGNVVIDNDVELGANVTVDRATVGSTVIGAGSKIDNLVQIAHNVKIGKGCLIVSQTGIAGSTELGDRVILAGQAGVAGHLRLGEGAIVTAQSGIMADVPKGQTVFGTPARPHREAFKLQVLYGRLPELFEAVKNIKERLGVAEK
ncbi:MAG: UDP-3-O-(3-hydroxymyristoyl)glucosamine N-acyltransferase [Elusimicrobia bacterium]|nr:UDP-3-O-(3-hydroxymyristoyl)glucosamine N-acyltransferase [Elusimicrobiota bacterium]